MPTYNIYCDESCHLPKDRSNSMFVGAVWCLADRTPAILARIAEIKEKHGLHPQWELKWIKASKSKLPFYLDILDFFFDDDDLGFRAVVADRTWQTHALTLPSTRHDDWYYGLLFRLLSRLLDPIDRHRIYLDFKDTHTSRRGRELEAYLRKSQSDFDHRIVERVQPVRSHETGVMQLCDLLLGALSYCTRAVPDSNSGTKSKIIERVRERSGLTLRKDTLVGAEKFNLEFLRYGGNS